MSCFPFAIKQTELPATKLNMSVWNIMQTNSRVVIMVWEYKSDLKPMEIFFTMTFGHHWNPLCVLWIQATSLHRVSIWYWKRRFSLEYSFKLTCPCALFCWTNRCIPVSGQLPQHCDIALTLTNRNILLPGNFWNNRLNKYKYIYDFG